MHEIVIFNVLRGKDGTVMVSYVDESTSKSGAWILPVGHPELSQCRTMDEFKQVFRAHPEYLLEWEEKIAGKLTDQDALGELSVEVKVDLPEDLSCQLDELSQALGVPMEDVGLAMVRFAVDPEMQDIYRARMFQGGGEGGAGTGGIRLRVSLDCVLCHNCTAG